MAQTVGQHGVAAFTSPVNGDPLNATVVVANDNATRGAYVDHDSDPDIHVQSSLLASRPAAGTAGRKWMTTDSGAVKLWFDTGSAWSEIAYLPSAGGTVAGNVSITGTLGVTGVLTATGGVVGAVTGNASTATALQTARAINGVNFDGTAAITVTAAAGTLTGATLASNVLASSLTSVGTLAALTVTAPITGSVTGSSGSTTGNAATATALQTGRAINGVTFDGTAPITVTAAAGTLSGATLASGVTASSLTSVGTLTGLTVTNPIVGSVTGSSGSTTGNAATATALQTARTINGTSFDGTANVTVTAAAGTLTGATLASGVTASSLTSVGTLGSLTVTTPITGSVTGSSGSTTGNAATATALQTARAINGTNFDGTAAITVTAAAGTLTGATLASNVLASSLTSVGTLAGLTVTAPITGSVTGSSGSTTGNAATATALQTSRNINGTAFNGTADITVTAAAGTLTGATLASGVTASSLTSVGTLTSLAVSGAATVGTTLGVTGNVTIGASKAVITAATGALTITHAAGAAVNLVGGNSYQLYADGSNNFGLFSNTAGVNRLVVDSSGNLAVDTNTLYVDATNNRVGVGTATPQTGFDCTAATARFSGATNYFEFSTNVLTSAQTDGASIRSVISTGANPTYAFAGDLDTGVFNAAANTLGFTTGGSERARLDASGNLGLGVTPSAWATSRAIDFGGAHSVVRGSLASVGNTQSLVANAYYDGAWKYVVGYNAQRYTIGDGSHSWHIAPSGTANAAITFTQAMTLDASGALILGTDPGSSERLRVGGDVRMQGSLVFMSATKLSLIDFADAVQTAVSGGALGIFQRWVGAASANGDAIRAYDNAASVSKGAFTGLDFRGINVRTATATGAGTITTAYGLYIDAQTIGGTNYAWYANTTAPTFLLNSGAMTVGSTLAVTGAFGMNGKTPVANVAAPTAAGAVYTATEQSLLNDIRTRLINLGIYT